MNENLPHVICHMMQTIDGKIDSGVEDAEFLMDYMDLYVKYEQKYNPDAFMFGRTTAEMFATAVKERDIKENTQQFENFYTNQDKERYTIITDTKGKLVWNKNYINFGEQDDDENLYMIIIVSPHTPQDYLDHLKSLDISFVVSEEDGNLTSALETVKREFGINKILLEGGGNLNGTMLQHNLINELSVIVAPIIANRKDAPSLFDLVQDSIKIKKMTLKETEFEDNGAIWLQYIL